MEINNTFFKLALNKAARLVGKPGRMLSLMVQLGHRLYTMDRKQLSISGIKDKLETLGRLVNSYAKGHYREISVKTLLKVLAALIYFLNPIDLIPDAIFGVGLVDDLAVLTWVFGSAKDELNKFIEWEKSKLKIIRL
ncbi:hypothetical protein BH09BAC3_BH09BAC3_13550 [soil metagenome]